MQVTQYKLKPVSLDNVIEAIQPALRSNYAEVTVEVAPCPDLRRAPFHLASEGLSGQPVISDIGGPTNLFPKPLLDKRYSMLDIAKDCMRMSPDQGMLIGAGAGPFFFIGKNAELALNLAWKDGFEKVNNLTHYTKMDAEGSGLRPVCEKCASTDCALIMNVFGSSGLPGPVLKITARKRVGSTNTIIDVIRFALRDHFGSDTPVSMGGVFVIKKGKANFHVMPDFPSEDKLPFETPKDLNDWLTYHDFAVEGEGKGDEIVCLSVLHSADPEKKMGVRLEHTHCFSKTGRSGGHYHYDLDDEDIEYEGYFNVAEAVYRVDRPEVTLERDLHE